MTMTEISGLMLALAAGGVLGLLFFGGLWWTVRRAVASPRPALWFFGSMLLRMGTVLSGFYVVASGDWQRLLACLCGFLLARTLVIRRTAPPVAAPPCTTVEANHAPEP